MAKKKEVQYRQFKAKYGTIYPGTSEAVQGEPLPLWFRSSVGTAAQGKKSWEISNIIPGGVHVQSRQGKQRRFVLSCQDLVDMAREMGIDDPDIKLEFPKRKIHRKRVANGKPQVC